MTRLKVLSIFGTRPEAIKMSPVVKELARHPDGMVARVDVPAQHREMREQRVRLFTVAQNQPCDKKRSPVEFEHRTRIHTDFFDFIREICVHPCPKQGDFCGIAFFAICEGIDKDAQTWGYPYIAT